jgi:antitoxin component YwqK of YwqJK toxin-antitoxin module
MKQILILLISVILFSCSNGDKRYHIDETTSPTDTLTYLKLDMTPLNGIVYCEFGDNGKYIKGKKDGIHKRWYDDGQLEFEGKYIDEKKDGKYKEWFKNGQLRSVENYDSGNLINHQIWNEDGGKYSSNLPINDSINNMKIWYNNGQLMKSYNLNIIKTNDLLSINSINFIHFEGEYKMWNENGEVNSIINYKNGVKNGIEENYPPNKIINKIITLWENGDKITETEFLHNIKYKVTYFKNGKKIKSEIGKNDIQTIFYDENENEIK